MPQTVTQGGTTKATYGWFTDGSKYSVQDGSGNGYYYIGSLIYSTAAGATALESTDFGEGRITVAGSSQTIHYHHKDHLGSIRAITNSSGTTIEQNAYYPFGGRHTFGQSYAQTSANRYKFNGKVEQTTGNLAYLDYGARMYDSKTARWLVQDPLAEKYYPHSPYNYCVNNPVKFVDPDGKKIIIGHSKDIQSIEKDGTDYEKQVYKDLIALIKMDPEIASVIQDLANSRHIIRILNTNEKPLDKEGKNNDGNAFIPKNSGSQENKEKGVHTGGTIYYNPSNKVTNQNDTRDPIIGLAHEIGHAYNAIMGERVVYNQDNARLGTSKKDVELGNMNEKRSIYLENIVRKKTNHKERSYEYYKIR